MVIIIKDIVSYFERTLDYLEGVISENQLEDKFADKLDEQRENLDDFRNVMNQYEKDTSTFTSYEAIESDETLNKLMTIHKFLADIEWHISEISELKDEVIKVCSSRRK